MDFKYSNEMHECMRHATVSHQKKKNNAKNNESLVAI